MKNEMPLTITSFNYIYNFIARILNI